jgi:hypothetical protein
VVRDVNCVWLHAGLYPPTNEETHMNVTAKRSTTPAKAPAPPARKPAAPSRTTPAWQPKPTLREGVVRPLGTSQGTAPADAAIAFSRAMQRLGWSEDWRWLDAELRGGAPGVSARALLDAALQRGFQASMYNHGSFAELTKASAQGQAILAMVDLGVRDETGVLLPGSRNDLATQWVTVSKAWVDQQGQRWVELENPEGTVERVKYERFEAMWHRLSVAGVPTGYDGSYMLLAKADAQPLPTSTADDVAGTSVLVDGANDVIRGLSGQGFGRLFGGVARVFAAIPLAAVELVRALFS